MSSQQPGVSRVIRSFPPLYRFPLPKDQHLEPLAPPSSWLYHWVGDFTRHDYGDEYWMKQDFISKNTTVEVPIVFLVIGCIGFVLAIIGRYLEPI